MVMVVFTLPSFDLVFKLIRDKFSPPKRGTHAKVSEKYELVFKHDRVGRLVDAQEFRNLEFRRDKFSPKLLEHLLELAPSIVKVKNNVVHLIHVYTERRVTPLDIYVKTQPFDKVRAAILDYGAAIKELAAANIFPGDLFLKNFGVTRHGRVVFYDYDELCLITECCFRRIPPPRYDFEELEPEPWFRVQENDVFPEEFQSFIGIPLGHREIFQSTHGDLFTAEFWKNLKEAHEEGKHFEIFPYPNASKL